MAHWNREQLAALTGGVWHGSRTCSELCGERISIDTRELEPGDVFFALRGADRHGADFVAEAISKRAAGIVSPKRPHEPLGDAFWLEVADPQAALERLADDARRQMSGTIVAVTGSVGKSTTRALIASVLSAAGETVSTIKNHNNRLGLALSMARMQARDRYGAFELAATAPGEIQSLAGKLAPQIGVLTTIGDAHLGGFGSVASIARGKSELIEVVPSDGFVVLNADDPWQRRMGQRLGRPVVWYGRSGDADITPTEVCWSEGWLTCRVDGEVYAAPLWGRHYLPSLLAAIAVGRLIGLAPRRIAEATAATLPLNGRCNASLARGVLVIDDTYNASPRAVHRALELLGEVAAPGRRVAVLGTMDDLGDYSERMHREIGEAAVTHCGADLVVACGPYGEVIAAGARAAGMAANRTWTVLDPAAATVLLQSYLEPGDAILFKASRTLRLERLVADVFPDRQPWPVAHGQGSHRNSAKAPSSVPEFAGTRHAALPPGQAQTHVAAVSGSTATT